MTFKYIIYINIHAYIPMLFIQAKMYIYVLVCIYVHIYVSLYINTCTHI